MLQENLTRWLLKHITDLTNGLQIRNVRINKLKNKYYERLIMGSKI